jgi:hypothetical protein
MSIRYMKAPPTTYVMQFKDGRVKREGPGLSFFYWAPTTTVVSVPLASSDVPFVFNEVTQDFQAVTLQGQLTYRVADPKLLSGLLDYSVKPSGEYASEDPSKLEERLVQVAQVRARTVVQTLPLREVLVSANVIEGKVLAALRETEAVPREALQRRADEAIYARRNAAVEQERRIKENEIATELSVEAGKRQIREAQIAADIAVEEQRASFMERWSENERKAAEAKAYALEKTLAPVRDMDWKVLMAASGGGNDPKLNIALAFREMAENAGKIGELNVSPDLLRSLLSSGQPNQARHG